VTARGHVFFPPTKPKKKKRRKTAVCAAGKGQQGAIFSCIFFCTAEKKCTVQVLFLVF